MKKQKAQSEQKLEPLKYDFRLIVPVRYSQLTPTRNFDFTKAEFLNYNITPEIGMDSEKGIIGISLSANGEIIETKEKVLEFKYLFEFNVPNLKGRTTVVDKNKSWRFINKSDDMLLHALMGVSYSTLRGIIIEKVKGSILEATFLPIIDPGILVQAVKAPKTP